MSQVRPVGPVLQDWRAEISCRTDEVGGSFSVFIFLGNVPADPDWLKDRGLAGPFDIFAPSSSPYNTAPSGSVVDGVVHLKNAILRLSSPEDDSDPLRDEAVLPILQNINWGVQKVDGEIVPLDSIPSLQVTIQRTPIISPIGGEKVEGEPVYFHDITRGRPGGYRGIIRPRQC